MGLSKEFILESIEDYERIISDYGKIIKDLGQLVKFGNPSKAQAANTLIEVSKRKISKCQEKIRELINEDN